MLRYIFATALIVSTLSLSATSTSLEVKIQKDLELLNLPAPSWRQVENDVCDVAIIGAGQAGVAIAHALELEGIYNVRVFDGEAEGNEGPWFTTARMETLRSSKKLRGPACLPHLTFQAWCEHRYGKETWDKVVKIPTKAWGKYLQWLRKTVGVSIASGWKLEAVVPNVDDSLTLHFNDAKKIVAKKVVFATGRSGFGGAEIPEYMKTLPKKLWAHTSEKMDPAFFEGKQVVVVGVGASGFDAAAVALEHGARSVNMVMRRKDLPTVNHAGMFAYPGFMRGFYYLSDKERSDFFVKVLESGIPPAQEALDRLEPYSAFKLQAATTIEKITQVGTRAKIETNNGRILADFIILATGYAVNGADQKEFSSFFDDVLLWQDRMPTLSPKFGRFPYLGSHFEFQAKTPQTAAYLSNLYCFNYGGFLSHGRICGDLDGLHIGIQRLVEGISIDLFLQDTCRNGEPTPHECPGTCQSGICSPFNLMDSD